MSTPSHIAPDGSIRMVDVSGKADTDRFARARARVRMTAPAREAIQRAAGLKGDVLVTAQVAGILAAKRTAELIPLAHPLPLSHCEVHLEWRGDVLEIEASARTVGPTGVEMEAMVAASVSALTVYDMAKALDRSIEIESVRLLEKRGGKSGQWTYDDAGATP